MSPEGNVKLPRADTIQQSVRVRPPVVASCVMKHAIVYNSSRSAHNAITVH